MQVLPAQALSQRQGMYCKGHHKHEIGGSRCRSDYLSSTYGSCLKVFTVDSMTPFSARRPMPNMRTFTSPTTEWRQWLASMASITMVRWASSCTAHQQCYSLPSWDWPGCHAHETQCCPPGCRASIRTPLKWQDHAGSVPHSAWYSFTNKWRTHECLPSKGMHISPLASFR